MAHDAFISYSHKDRSTANAACAALESANIRCWIAPRDVSPGAPDWPTAIMGAIDNCRVMVLIFSSDANSSQDVQREVHQAFSRSVPVIPLRVQDTKPTDSLAYFLDRVHWLDALTPPLEEHLQRLTEAVKAILQVPPEASGGKPPRADSETTAKLQKDQSQKFVLTSWKLISWQHWAVLGIFAVVAIGLAGALAVLKLPKAPEVLPPIASGPNEADILRNIILTSHNEALNLSTVRMDSSFLAAFNNPIDAATLNIFTRQGFPSELLGWLFWDSFRVGPPGHEISYWYNPPVSYGCPRTPVIDKQLCYKDWILMTVLSGLTVEQQTIANTSNTGNSDRTPVGRFCFSPLMAHTIESEMGPEEAAHVRNLMASLFNLTNAQPICGSPWDAEAQAKKPRSDMIVLLPSPNLQFRIGLRSAYSVFQFLGSLLRVERENLQPVPTAYVPPSPLMTNATDPPMLITTPEDRHLFTVVKDDRMNPCFVRVSSNDGGYCVPDSATNTKRIFILLAQLIGLHT